MHQNIGSAHIFYGPLSGTIDLSSSGESSGKITGETTSIALNTNFGKVMSLADIDANGEADILIGSDLNDGNFGHTNCTTCQDSGGVFLFTQLID